MPILPLQPKSRRVTSLSPSRVSLLAACLCILALAGCASGPRWQGLTASELFEMARSEFAAEKYGDASETLERLVLGASGFEQAAEAQLMLAEAYFLDEQFILAQSEYTRFIDRYPAHPRAPEAALGVCRANEALSPITQRDQTFTEQAVQVCQNVAADWAGQPAAEEAGSIAAVMRTKLAKKQYENGAYYLNRDVPDAAILYWQRLLSTYPESEWAPAALAGIIEAYTEIGYDDEVEAATTRLLAEYPDSPEARAHGGGGEGTSGGG